MTKTYKDPFYYDNYFGHNAKDSKQESDELDNYMFEWCSIYGHAITVYPVSEYDIDRDQIFGEDTLMKYGAGVHMKGMWEVAQNDRTFGLFDMMSLDELQMSVHTGSCIQYLGRQIRVGDWIRTDFDNIVWEVVNVKQIQEQPHLRKYVSDILMLPRIVSNERIDTQSNGTSGDYADDFSMPTIEANDGTIVPLDGDNLALENEADNLTVDSVEDEHRKDYFGGW